MACCDTLKPATSCDTYLGSNSKYIRGSETLDIDISKGSPGMDYPAHIQTYKDFVRALKYGVIIVAVILIGMKIFLV
jgi:Bacterial aa3 type cytochrome c oxidase subunit IV